MPSPGVETKDKTFECFDEEKANKYQAPKLQVAGKQPWVTDVPTKQSELQLSQKVTAALNRFKISSLY